MPEIRIKDIDEHEIDTILAEDIDFEGHLTFKKPLMIKGKFKGEIKSPSSLYVGERAHVEARIEAGLVSSKGRITGDVQGHARVELFSTAQQEGDVSTPDFVVESGCRFNGLCSMGGASQKAEAQQPHAPPAAAHALAAPHASAAPAAAPPGAPAAAAAPHGDRNGASAQDRPPQNPAAAQQKPQTPPGGGR
jgi:cytoskeletal protein CcmA (bactofilin family)